MSWFVVGVGGGTSLKEIVFAQRLTYSPHNSRSAISGLAFLDSVVVERTG
jgi:hypothetical protein